MSVKHVLRKVLYTMGIIAFAGSLFGCTKNKNVTQSPDTVKTENNNTVNTESPEEIVSFYLNRTGYDVLETYDVKKEDGGDSEDILKELAKVCARYDVASWDGYDESTEMLDGEGFTLEIKYAGGKTVKARGDNAFPEDYFSFVEGVWEVFAPYDNAEKEKEKQAAIEKGINGKVNFIMFTIVQSGDAGRDSYSVVISEEDIVRYNFNVQVNSKSGEVFPQGEYKRVTSVSDNLIDFDKLQEIIEKYDLIQWYGYEEIAEDYGNKEFFSATIEFDDGLVIEAKGSKHPENYKKFRKEFLEWVKETADAVEAVRSTGE